jgi:hypothetical protein
MNQRSGRNSKLETQREGTVENKFFFLFDANRPSGKKGTRNYHKKREKTKKNNSNRELFIKGKISIFCDV